MKWKVNEGEFKKSSVYDENEQRLNMMNMSERNFAKGEENNSNLGNGKMKV